jgi:hypothetical protein
MNSQSKPTKAEIVRVLREQIRVLHESYKVGGIVDDAAVKREVECLRRAIGVVRKADV